MQVLFVEDDALIREVIAEYLRDNGFDVVEVATAEEAMLVMTAAASLVVTDIDLGAGRSGLDLADWVHARWPELRVVFVTGRLDRLGSRALDPREAFLGKPFALGTLVELVRRFAPACVIPSASPCS